MASIFHPLPNQALRQPVSPVNFQTPFNAKVSGGDSDVGEKDQYNKTNLPVQAWHGALFQCIEEAGTPFSNDDCNSYLHGSEHKQS